MPTKVLIKGDYVLAIQPIGAIQVRSVGLVKNVSNAKIIVYFVGKDITVTTDSQHVSVLDITKTGKPHPKKICNICHLLKDDKTEFEINQTNAQGRKTTRPSCRECRKSINGKNLTPDENKKLEAIKPKEIFICPICKKRTIVGVTANLVKDHDHKTGKGRAWICDSCNTGLGRFKDDIAFLQHVIDYLKKYS